MTPHEGDDPPHSSSRRVPEQWTQADLDALHNIIRESKTFAEIIENYKNSKWLKKQLVFWVGWGTGIPAAAIYFWEPLEKLIKLIRGH